MSAPPARNEAGQEVHALSCVNCRQRKVKCAKTYPCPHCVRGGLECIFPSRKKDRAPRRNKNHELLNRLAKLEAIVGQADTSGTISAVGRSAPSGAIKTPAAVTTTVSTTAPAAAPNTGIHAAGAPSAPSFFTPLQQRELEIRNPQTRSPASQPVSKDDPAAKYVSGEFWANLSREVEGIKAALEEPSESEDEHADEEDAFMSPESAGQSTDYQNSPATFMSSAAVFGNKGAAEGVRLRHPPPETIKTLRSLYFRNVDPLLKILHRPTIDKIFDIFIVNPEDHPLSRPVEALFFAIYFAAVTSTSSEKCRSFFGEDRAILSGRYRHSVEIALAKADYLSSSSLETLQALMLYDTCIRNYGESRASWALLGLVVRLAQAIGLHRDGDGAVFTPYEAEMRRRLWSQVIVLDVRAAQDRGTEPMIHQEDFNTISPTNVNDDDFGPSTTAPIPQLARDGPSDITFSLCTYECSNLFIYIHGPRARFSTPDPSLSQSNPQLLSQVSEEDIIQRIKVLEIRFINPAPSHPGHFPTALAAAVVRLTTLIFWLTIQYPFQVRQPTIKPRVSREHMLQTAIAIIDLTTLGPGGGVPEADYKERFRWWQDGYVQWHPLSVALAELCVQTEGPLVERAWRTVDRVLPLWRDKVADRKGGALWRPIRKLARRAKEKRAQAQMRRLRINEEGSMVQDQPQQQQQGSEQPQQQPGQPIQSQPQPAPAQQQQQQQRQQHQQQEQTPTSVPHKSVSSGPSPVTAATELGPLGIPMDTDFSGINAAMNKSSLPIPSPKPQPQPQPQSQPHPTAVANNVSNMAATYNNNNSPVDFLYQNAAHQWTIDFSVGSLGDDITYLADGGFQPQLQQQQQQDFDMMDWSVWNDFVNDATVTFDDGTSPSSEGK